jgi:hypothetical protein
MNKIVTAVALAGASLCMTGCASLFGSNSDADRTMMVTSNPLGAQVFLNNQPVGVTPIQVQVSNPTKTNTITLQQKGYHTTTVPVATSFQGVGALNIFFWPGFLVDYLTGDMMKVSDHSMAVTLVPADSNHPPLPAVTPAAPAAVNAK